MDELLRRSWWMLAFRGIFALLFGIVALVWPVLTLLTLVVLFATYALLGGASATVAALKYRKSDQQWWLLLLLGLVGLGTGVFALVHPALTALALVLVMGANALITGVLELAVAIRLRKVGRGEWLLIVSAIVSVIFGVVVFLFPAAGALAMVGLISLYAVVAGVLSLSLAVRVRKWTDHEGTAAVIAGRAG